MPKKSTKPKPLSYSWGEFDGHPAEEKLHTAFGFDLPRVCEAAWECVEALREEQAIEASWPADVREAADQLREIAPRHQELAFIANRSPKQQEELDLLGTELLQAIQILQRRPRRLLRTRRDMNAIKALTDLLFQTSADKWRSLTGRERPRNLTELREAMAEAGCTLTEIHNRDLTPRYAEPILLGRLRTNNEGPKAESSYLGDGRLRIGAETMVFEGQELFVLEAIVELQAATKTQLESKSGVSDAVRILKRMVAKHPSMKACVTIPGIRGAGGYQTNIRRTGS